MISLKECSNCGKERPVWKRVKNKPYCQQCSMILFGKKKEKSFKPIKQRSTKKIKEDSEYSKLRREFLTNHPVCMAHLPGCTQQSTDVHHVKGRGKNYLEVGSWVSLCRSCHTYIELHPSVGRDINMVKSRK